MFEVGQEVWDTVLGKGSVWCISTTSALYPVRVKFDNGLTESYNFQGKCTEKNKRSLFFSEPIVTAELFPPKKPFKPTLKRGDTVLVLTASSEKAQVVVEETEEMLYTVLTDYKKSEITRVYKIGKEIKFD